MHHETRSGISHIHRNLEGLAWAMPDQDEAGQPGGEFSRPQGVVDEARRVGKGI